MRRLFHVITLSLVIAVSAPAWGQQTAVEIKKELLPKMKKADPESRIWCRQPAPPPNAPPGSRVLQCQNTTMAQLVERLQTLTPDLVWPVANNTEIEGGYDFTLTFAFRPMIFGGGPAMAARPGGAGDMPSASDPVAMGVSIFDAVEKQLGLKLEPQKISFEIYVIDHAEKPSE